MKVNNPDEKLILRIAEKDKAAFEELYRQTSSAVYGFALSILKNQQDAEDVMHDTFLRIYAYAEKYRPRGKPMAWVLTIVRNLSYNRLRQQKTDPFINGHENTGISPANEHAIGDDTVKVATDRVVLEAAMKNLSSDERQIVVLHAVTGMTYKEIADLLEMPAGTVMSKYSRAMKKMKSVLNEAK